MLQPIKEVPVIRKSNLFQIRLDSYLESKVCRAWESFVQKHQGYWDGYLLAVVNFDFEMNFIEIGVARYSWLIYSKTHDDLDIRSLFVSILFKTQDDYYVVLKNNHGKINIIGGVVEPGDLEGAEFHPEVCLKRELLEELKLDLNNQEHVLEYHMKYLKTPNPGRNYGIVYTGVLNFTKDELLQYFYNIKTDLDQEINKLLVLSGKEVLSLQLSDGDISYLVELIKFEL